MEVQCCYHLITFDIVELIVDKKNKVMFFNKEYDFLLFSP